jgi:hypothetical protein
MGENETPDGPDLDLDRFQAILGAYGASPDRWPGAERTRALSLLAHSADAKRIHAAAGRLDSVLDSAAPPPPDAAFAERIRGLPRHKPEAASAVRASGFAALARISAVVLVGLVGVAIGLAIPSGGDRVAGRAGPSASVAGSEIGLAELPPDSAVGADAPDADGARRLAVVDPLEPHSAPGAETGVSLAGLTLH